jgi:hypothetical protein
MVDWYPVEVTAETSAAGEKGILRPEFCARQSLLRVARHS